MSKVVKLLKNAEPPQPKLKKCRWWSHEWGKWGIFATCWQRRQCANCGKSQQRGV